MKKSILFLMGFLFLFGCASARRGPSADQISSADYGPFPETWRMLVEQALMQELVRPMDMYIQEAKPPIKAWIATPDQEIIFGWASCGFVANPRARLEPFFIAIHGNQVVYKALGYDLAIGASGKKWMRANVNSFKDVCPGLFW